MARCFLWLAVEIDTLGSSYREHFKLFVIAGSFFFSAPWIAWKYDYGKRHGLSVGGKINPHWNRFIKTGFLLRGSQCTVKRVLLFVDAYIEQGPCLTWSTVAWLCCRWSLQTRTAHREHRAAWTDNTVARWWVRATSDNTLSSRLSYLREFYFWHNPT